jgi:hypothetical protein
MVHPGEKIRTPDAVIMLQNSWERLSLAAMESAWSISDGRERRRPDGEVDEWDPDTTASDVEPHEVSQVI